jgi:SAM-dependent methyltransferase
VVDVDALLRCPCCHGALDVDGNGRRCASCDRTYPAAPGWLDFLLPEDAAGLDIETNYEWDYRHDPRVSPLTLERWRILAEAHADAVLTGTHRPVVVSVGGGGENWLLPHLDQRVGAYLVVEPSEAQLRETRLGAGTPGLLLRAAAERLPLGDGSADVVELHSVIDHLADPEQALAELVRVLRPGGRVTVTIGNDGSWYRRLAGRIGIATHDEHAHARRFDVPGVRALLAGAGLQPMAGRTFAYLRLPSRIERLAERLSPSARRRLVHATDRVGRRLLGPTAGGMLLVVARRP